MPSATASASSGDYRMQATISPAQAGGNTIQIIVTDGEGAVIAGREVDVALSNPAAGVEPIRRAATPTRAGTWYLTDIPLAPPGTWSVRVDMLVDDFQKPIFEAEVEIR